MKMRTILRVWQLRFFSKLIDLVKRTFSLGTGRKPNTPKTYSIRLWHQLNVPCTLDARPMPRGFALRKKVPTCSKSATETLEQDSK